MQIEYLQDAPHAELSLEGSVLIIAGLGIDLETRQADSQEIIDITKRDEHIVEGINGQDGSYVASVILPPKEYEEVDTGEEDEHGNPVYEKTALPLDTNRVVLKLWQLTPDQTEEE